MSRKVYHVKYVLAEHSGEKGVDVIAGNAAEAYDAAVYSAIPEKEGAHPYGAYVYSCTYSNGNYHRFDKNLIGKPY